MGNLAPRMRRDEATAATGGGRKRCLFRNAEADAPAGRADTVVARKRRPAGEKVAESAVVKVVTVKVVVTRKDTERLATRLNEQRARWRKARMAELKNELRAGAGGGLVVSPARSRDAWTMMRLAPIQEN
ncbi:hypothetical protein GUJ93_ZPchr0001g32377 [Zizania palustris]|uniref:Uncharacterized protein n=1 Tax=Zizania palustris TaxID=103762 RepID=A0A8J5V9C1_ZIZPA|nr:hypothetical protein GUJ93_ZPchr0001g32377 [Zizania palustris]